MSKLYVSGLNISVEIADKTYGNGTSSMMNISAKVPQPGLPLDNPVELIDEGLGLYLTVIETLMAGRLASEQISEEQYKSFMGNAQKRIAEVRAELQKPRSGESVQYPTPGGDLPKNITSTTPAAVAITPAPAENMTAFVESLTPTDEEAAAAVAAGRAAIKQSEAQAEAVSGKNEKLGPPRAIIPFIPLQSEDFAARLQHLESWVYGPLPRDARRQHQLVRYALFLVPTATKVNIERDGLLVSDAWKAEMLKLEKAERRQRLAMLEGLAVNSAPNPEDFIKWATAKVNDTWGSL